MLCTLRVGGVGAVAVLGGGLVEDVCVDVVVVGVVVAVMVVVALVVVVGEAVAVVVVVAFVMGRRTDRPRFVTSRCSP